MRDRCSRPSPRLRLLVVAVAAAQTPAPAPAERPRGASGIVVASPTYTSILMEIAVNRPAADVWKRVGKFCDIGEWLRIPCTITSGKDGEFGAIRSVANEVLVGKTELSYTYTQPVRKGAVQPLSRHARGAAGDRDHVEAGLHAVLRQLDAGRRCGARNRQDAADRAVHEALENMKILAEGGARCRRRRRAAAAHSLFFELALDVRDADPSGSSATSSRRRRNGGPDTRSGRRAMRCARPSGSALRSPGSLRRGS